MNEKKPRGRAAAEGAALPEYTREALIESALRDAAEGTRIEVRVDGQTYVAWRDAAGVHVENRGI